MRLIIGSAAAVSLAFLAGCNPKAATKPRSELIEQAKDNGQRVMSADQERELFFKHDETEQKRLLSVLKTRSSGEIRDATYHIGPGDEIEVNVFDVPELNLTAKVNQTGFVSLPLVGGIKAGGLTESDFKDELTRRLSSFVRNPQVSAAVANFGSQKVAVMGAVQRPGTYPLRKGANSILEVLSEAGGVTDRAGNYLNFVPAELSGVGSGNDVQSRARLALDSRGSTNDQPHSIEVYLEHVLGTTGGIPLEIPVRGGDMIIVPEAGKIMVEGEVATNGSFELGSRSTLLGALAAAGGITYAAKVDEVEVVRDVGNQKKTHLVVNLESISTGEEHDVRLRNGDIIRVPSESGRRLTQDTFDGITKIINFGIGGSVNLAN